MTQFTKSFLWRFILDIILLGIFVRLLQNIILAILSRSMETYSTPFLIIEAVVVSVISMLFICFITYWNIGVISKKGCYDYPMDSDKWFRNFAFINIGINLISTIISFIQWRGNVAEQNARLDHYAENTYFTEAVERSRRQISSIWILARLYTKKAKPVMNRLCFLHIKYIISPSNVEWWYPCGSGGV